MPTCRMCADLAELEQHFQALRAKPTPKKGGAVMATILQQLRALTPPRGLSYVDALSVAERQALRLLQLLMLDGPLVPEEALTGLPRLRVERISPLPASGATQWIHGRWVILLNGAEAPVRQRFSLAHELKHVIDHERIKILYPDSGGA